MSSQARVQLTCALKISHPFSSFARKFSFLMRILALTTHIHLMTSTSSHLSLRLRWLHPKWKEIKKKIMLRKATKFTCMSNVLSKSERTSQSLTPQLDTVINEVSSVKGLSLRGNPLRLYRDKHLPLMNWMGDTTFYIG